MQRFEIQGRYYDDLLSGLKIAEGRGINSRMNRETNIGDIITIFQDNKEFKALIMDKRYYPSVEDMLRTIGVNNMLPDVDTIEEGIKVYERFGITGGAVALFFKVVR